MVKLLHIVRSPVMDRLLKRSALQQLAILLTGVWMYMRTVLSSLVG